jgi:hypothetical protein
VLAITYRGRPLLHARSLSTVTQLLPDGKGNTELEVKRERFGQFEESWTASGRSLSHHQIVGHVDWRRRPSSQPESSGRRIPGRYLPTRPSPWAKSHLRSPCQSLPDDFSWHQCDPDRLYCDERHHHGPAAWNLSLENNLVTRRKSKLRRSRYGEPCATGRSVWLSCSWH